jgi:propionyl-CoA carboxylase alpha chain
VSTDFFGRRHVVQEPTAPAPQLLLAAAILLAEDDRARRRVQQGIPVGWRNVTSQRQRTVLLHMDDEHVVEWLGTRDGYAAGDTRVVEASPTSVVLESGGVSAPYTGLVLTAPDGTREVHVDGPWSSASLREEPRFIDPAEQVREGSLVAPMPGTVVSVAVEAGDLVEQGQAMLVLEAMKMQHTVTAPTTGVVTEIDVEPGVQVAAGAVLAVVEGDGA